MSVSMTLRDQIAAALEHRRCEHTSDTADEYLALIERGELHLLTGPDWSMSFQINGRRMKIAHYFGDLQVLELLYNHLLPIYSVTRIEWEGSPAWQRVLAGLDQGRCDHGWYHGRA